MRMRERERERGGGGRERGGERERERAFCAKPDCGGRCRGHAKVDWGSESVQKSQP